MNKISEFIDKHFKTFKTIYFKYEGIILYLIFGGLTTLVNFVVYIPLSFLGINELICNTIAWVFAVTFAFFTNRTLVFKSPTNTKKAFFLQMFAFYGSRVFSLIVETAILATFVTWLGFNEYIIKIIAAVFVVILNYILGKLIVFRKKKKTK